MNLDKHKVLAPTPSWHTCGAMCFFVKKHLAQQEVLGVNSMEMIILSCDMYVILNITAILKNRRLLLCLLIEDVTLCDAAMSLNWSHQIVQQMPNLVPRETNR